MSLKASFKTPFYQESKPASPALSVSYFFHNKK